MKVISIKVHGFLDFFTVLAFALIPTVFGLSGVPAYLSYALAIVHLAMTLLTNFPFGIVKVIPVKLHKIVETIVGPALLAVPWIFGFSEDVTARSVFIGAGLVILAVRFLTDY
jgi:hypothetical protein